MGGKLVAEYDWVARIAGTFELRAQATFPGNRVEYSNISETKAVVRFPTYAQIVAAPVAKAFLDAAWAQSLLQHTPDPPLKWRETGFWIGLNTVTNSYVRTQPTKVAEAIHPADPSIKLGARPADSPQAPLANAAGAVYTVASFHTHPPMTYCPPGSSSGVGPSPADEDADEDCGVPGVVYDYVASPMATGKIFGGHPKDAAAILYPTCGEGARRPTP